MKNALLLLFLIGLLSSCGNDGSGNSDDDMILTSNSRLEATIDGQKLVCIPSTVTATGTEGPYYALVVGGLLDGTTFDGLGVGLDMGTDITGPTYESNGDCNGYNPCHFIQYSLNETQADETYFTSGDDENTRSSINFETLEYEEGGKVKGTFNGIIVNDETGESLTVTNGFFETTMTID